MHDGDPAQLPFRAAFRCACCLSCRVMAWHWADCIRGMLLKRVRPGLGELGLLAGENEPGRFYHASSLGLTPTIAGALRQPIICRARSCLQRIALGTTSCG